MPNDALQSNPFVVNGKTVAIHITTRGSDWYWAVMAIMGATMLGILAASVLKPARNRLLFYIFALITFVATLESFSIGSNLGWTPINAEWHRTDAKVAGVNRQIWYVRYIGWFLTWPLITTTILLTTYTPTLYILWTGFFAAAMAVLALVGALVHSDYKWGYYAFWLFSWLLVGYHLVWLPRAYARNLGVDVLRAHTSISAWVWFLLGLYPICWGVSEGGNVIAPDSELVFYGVLDILLMPVTFGYFLFVHWNIDPARLGLSLRTYEDPLPGGLAHHEKSAPGATNGTIPTDPIAARPDAATV
ncbi:hypothetical protein EDD36DRAFT_465068 [Exophiala viscosa]|uniref:Opsin n=1 Tax=Exophiala viscosa TaxID=2486360 RepID=A0AAN6ICZ7_9EURO|nr:hypothetical protein EDD36DRAFT_465068 [Exophiala viscosa]